MKLVILTGASGSGKTAIASVIAARHGEEFDIRFFDDIGVPPLEEMVTLFGSPAGWQRAMTAEWMAKLASAPPERPMLFEGQMRLSFLADAAAAAGVVYHAILVDCDDETRKRRLAADRNQPDLADENMMSWAAYLRREAEEAGCEILDTSATSLEEAADLVAARLRD